MFDKSGNDLGSLYSRVILREQDEPVQLSVGEITQMRNEVTEISRNLIRRLNAPVHRGEQAPWNVHGNILKRLKVTVLTPDMPKAQQLQTMAVSNNGDLFINYEFYKKLQQDAEAEGIDKNAYIEGVFMHEAFHVYNETFARQGNRNPGLWNVATDYVMNRDLIKGGFALPSLGLIPERRGDEYWINIDVRNISHAAAQGGQVTKAFTDDESVIDFNITQSTCEEVYAKFEDYFEDIPEELKQQIQEALEEMGEEMDSHPSDGDEGEEGQAGEDGDSDDGKLEEIAKQAAAEAEENGQEAPSKDNERDEDEGDGDGDSGEDAGDGDEAGQGADGGSLGQGEIETSALDQICNKYPWKKLLSDFLHGKDDSNRGDFTTSKGLDIRQRDDSYVMGRIQGGSFRAGYPGYKTTTQPVQSKDTVAGVFCLDTSGSMITIIQKVRYALACLAKEFRDTLKIAIVHQMRVVDENSFLELNDKLSIEQIVGQMNAAWKKTQTGGVGPDLFAAIDYFDRLKQSPNGRIYKHFFIVSDTGWTDPSYGPDVWRDAMFKMQKLSGAKQNEGLCVIRTDRARDHHPFEHDLDFHRLDAGTQSNIKQLVPYIDLPVHGDL